MVEIKDFLPKKVDDDLRLKGDRILKKTSEIVEIKDLFELISFLKVSEC